MNFSTSRSERVTAIVSTLVAVAILAGGVTAYQSHSEPVDDIVQLESDLRFQLEFAFRHNPNERAKRLVQLQKVSQAWQKSPRDTADQAALASWLLEATIRSMPGSIEPLPAIPQFGERPKLPEAPRPALLITPPVTAEQLDTAEQQNLVPQPVTPPLPVANPTPPLSQIDAPETLRIANPQFSEPPPIAVVTPRPPTILPPPAVAPVRINLTELAARIAGYHNGLDEVENALLKLEANDFRALTDQVRKLSEMTGDFQFVRMYYETLTDKEREAVTTPRSLAATVAEVKRRLDHSPAGQPGDFLDEFDSRNQARIAVLREQLAEVARRADR